MASKLKNPALSKLGAKVMESPVVTNPAEELTHIAKKDFLSDYKVQMIPVEKLIPTKSNRELYDGEDEWTDESLEFIGKTILHSGILQPLVVVPIEGSENYQVLSGERRLTAFKILQREKKTKGIYSNGLPCHIMTNDMHPLQKEWLLAIANSSGRDRDYVVQYKEYIRMVEIYDQAQKEGVELGNYSREELISEKLNIQKRMVSHYAAMQKLLPSFLEMFENGTIGVTLAAFIGAKPEDVQEEILSLINKKNYAPQEAYDIVNKAYQEERSLNSERNKQIRELKSEAFQLKNNPISSEDQTAAEKQQEDILNKINALNTAKANEKKKRQERIKANIEKMDSATAKAEEPNNNISSLGKLSTGEIVSNIKNNILHLRMSGHIDTENIELTEALADLYQLSRRYLSLSEHGKTLILEEEKNMPVSREGINNSNESGEFIV